MGYLTPCLKKKKLSFFKLGHSFKITYLLRFASLFSPSTIKDFRLLIHSSAGNLRNPFSDASVSKILVKQSYVLLVWFYYLTSSSRITHEEGDTVQIPGFFIFPKRVTKFTLIKSPMAHKTFSQEQFSFSTYKFSLGLTVDTGQVALSQKDSMPFILRYLAGLNLFYGTNLLFLKNFIAIVPVQDKLYFSAYLFFNAGARRL